MPAPKTALRLNLARGANPTQPEGCAGSARGFHVLRCDGTTVQATAARDPLECNISSKKGRRRTLTKASHHLRLHPHALPRAGKKNVEMTYRQTAADQSETAENPELTLRTRHESSSTHRGACQEHRNRRNNVQGRSVGSGHVFFSTRQNKLLHSWTCVLLLFFLRRMVSHETFPLLHPCPFFWYPCFLSSLCRRLRVLHSGLSEEAWIVRVVCHAELGTRQLGPLCGVLRLLRCQKIAKTDLPWQPAGLSFQNGARCPQ